MAELNLSKLKKEQFYKKPKMVGDRRGRSLLDFYLEQRKKILAYQGTSAVNKKRFYAWEKIFIKDNRDFWWHRADKSYLSNVLWFLRRLKVGITQKDEKKLFVALFNKFPMFRRYEFSYGTVSSQIIKLLEPKSRKNNKKVGVW